MSREHWIRLIAGSFIIVSAALLGSRHWLWLALFLGVYLFPAALARGLMEEVVHKLGAGEGSVVPAAAQNLPGRPKPPEPMLGAMAARRWRQV